MLQDWNQKNYVQNLLEEIESGIFYIAVSHKSQLLLHINLFLPF